MKIVYFTHSLKSCWNHGNAHFLRGILRELIHGGHDVIAYEAENAWSLENLLRDHGEEGLQDFCLHYPELRSEAYASEPDLDRMLDSADAVIVHEWTNPAIVDAIGTHHRRCGRYTLLFHDTHHRAVSAPDAIRAYNLAGYDGILAFGEALAAVYRRWGWGRRVFVWHEAADIRLFHPPAHAPNRDGLVFIGNWGDEERTAELESLLLRPAAEAQLALDIYGVRYPDHGRDMLASYGAIYRGWLANARVPHVFARHIATVHVPRSFYVTHLPGIPTIRVFEALACGIPLASAYWDDAEGLFSPGEDFLVARDGAEMRSHLEALTNDEGLRRTLVENGLRTIRERHNCKHRAEELLQILQSLGCPLSRAGIPMLEASL